MIKALRRLPIVLVLSLLLAIEEKVEEVVDARIWGR